MLIDNAIVITGDCLDELRKLPDGFVDAVVTDPPAGIGFMGKSWDSDKGGRDQWIAWLASVMRECLRVLKPGGHALVWALPRTSHWTATAVEDAGFEVRDVVTHLFGTGFPKSLDVSKAIDKAAGTDEAKRWQGFGTALKPASERWVLCRKPTLGIEHPTGLGADDWILARKPLEGTVAANVLAHGTGALNVDGCRIEYQSDADKKSANAAGKCTSINNGDAPNIQGAPRKQFKHQDTIGRWPANLTLDEDAAAALDEMSGDSKSSGSSERNFEKSNNDNPSRISNNIKSGVHFNDSGGASRFFYIAKCSTSEREAGLDHLPVRSAGESIDSEDGSVTRTGAGGGRRNHHPTVKSIALMRWLCRLITPPGGTVLDPFCGSGSTGCAAVLEGFDFIGIEQDPEFAAIAEARITYWSSVPRKEV